MLRRIQSSMAAMRTKLFNDDVIRKLLCYDGNDALLLSEAPSEKEYEKNKYITLRPVFEFENKEEHNQNSIINIYMTEATPFEQEKAIGGVVQVNVVCNQDVWDLVDDKSRPIELVNRIEKLLNNCKFTVSNKLSLSTVTDLIINKKIFGYAMLFEITDGIGQKDKF